MLSRYDCFTLYKITNKDGHTENVRFCLKQGTEHTTYLALENILSLSLYTIFFKILNYLIQSFVCYYYFDNFANKLLR